MVAFDLCHVLCTSIAEIKGFRFRLEEIICHTKEIVKIMRYRVSGRPAPKIHSALLGGACHRSDGLTLP